MAHDGIHMPWTISMVAHHCQSIKIKLQRNKIKDEKKPPKKWKNYSEKKKQKTQNYHDLWVSNLINFLFKKKKKTKLLWPMSARSDT